MSKRVGVPIDVMFLQLSWFDINVIHAIILGFNGEADIHICGSCQSQFHDIEGFILHKHQGCQLKASSQDGSRPKPDTLHPNEKPASMDAVEAAVGEAFTGGNSLEEAVPSLSSPTLCLPREVTQPCVRPSDVFKQPQTAVPMLPMQAAAATSPEQISIQVQFTSKVLLQFNTGHYHHNYKQIEFKACVMLYCRD